MRRPIEPEYRSVRVTTGICAGTLPAFCALDQGGLELHYDAEIRSAVETCEYTDPRSADWIGGCPIERRDKIAEAWFTKVPTLDSFRISHGKLVFEDLATALWLATTGNYTAGLVRCNADGCAETLPEAVAKAPTFRESAGPEAIGTKNSCCIDPRSRLRQMMTAPAGLLGTRHRTPSATD